MTTEVRANVKPKKTKKNKQLDQFRDKMIAFINGRMSGDIRTIFVSKVESIYKEVQE